MIINRKQNLIADIIILLLATTIFYCGYTSIGFTYFTTNILQDLVKNMQTSPIIDIKAAVGICPVGYEPLLESEWPGTVQGCDCSHMILFPDVKRGKCKKGSSCYNINPIQPVELNVWDANLICAKRHIENYLYFLEQESSCTFLNKKSCWKLDRVGNQYCVEQNENCFVNQISISESQGQNSIPLANNKYLSFSTTDQTNFEAIVEFKTSEGVMCLDPNQKNLNGSAYNLLNTDKYTFYCTNSQNGEYYDTRYNLVDQCPLGEFYDYNKLTPIVNSLPMYNIPASNMNLYSRGFLGWNQNCVLDEHLNPRSLIESTNKLPNLNFYQSIVYWASIVYFPLAILLVIIKYNGVYKEPNNKEASSALKCADGVNFIYVLLSMICCIVTYAIGKGLVNFFVALKTSNCGDEITNFALYTLGGKLESNIAKNFYSLIFYILTLVVIPLNILIMHYRENDSSLENIEVEMSSYVQIPENKLIEEN